MKTLDTWRRIVIVVVVALAAGAGVTMGDEEAQPRYRLPEREQDALRYSVTWNAHWFRDDRPVESRVEAVLDLWSEAEHSLARLTKWEETVTIRGRPVDREASKQLAGTIVEFALSPTGKVSDVAIRSRAEEPPEEFRQAEGLLRDIILPLMFVEIPEEVELAEGAEWGERRADRPEAYSDDVTPSFWQAEQLIETNDTQLFLVTSSQKDTSSERPLGPPALRAAYCRVIVEYDSQERRIRSGNYIYRRRIESAGGGMPEIWGFDDCIVREVPAAARRN